MRIWKSDETGTWFVSYEHDGKEATMNTGATTRAEAEHRCKMAKIAEMETIAAVSRLTAETISVLTSGQRVTMDEAVDEYEKWSSQERAGKTTSNSLSILRKFVRETGIGSIMPGQVKTETVTEFINRPELKLSTRKMHRATISAFFEFVSHKGWVIGNPAARAIIRYDEIPIEMKERKAKALFTQGEIEYLIGSLEGFWKYAVILSSEMGLRLSDVCSLEWGSFDLRKGVLTLWMEKTSARISLPMTPLVRKIALRLPQTDKRWVFPEQRETWVRAQSTLSHQFKRICASLNLDGKSFHSLRASYATHEYTRLANAAVNTEAMEKVAGKLGHKSSATTAKHYVASTA